MSAWVPLWLALLAPPGEPALPTVIVSADAAPRAPSPVLGSATIVDADDIRAAGPGIDLSEVLHRIPGVVANNRGNYAQDTQLSVRGYGARATFGVRGVRLYVNGVPATAPDGQGQIAHAALDGIARIEVLRGPLAALYGNAAGAVIKIDGDPSRDPGAVATVFGGRDFDRESVAWRGGDDAFAAQVLASRLAVDGDRPHGAAKRETIDALARWRHGDWTTSVTANAYDSPYAEDPLGLTAQQFADSPRQVTPQALQFDTRKRVRQRQAGAAIVRDDDALGLRIAPYAGTRDVLQFLAVPVAAQANPLSGGGVVDLSRDYGGVELRGWRRVESPWGPLSLTAGANVDALRERRRGFENFIGTTLGVRGALRRDERDEVDALDLIATVDWQPAERWRVAGGLRASRVTIAADDRFVTATNPDDSGRRRFRANNPALGVSFAASNASTWHASVARATEVPTLNELAYREDGSAGLNLALDAARATRREAGWRWQRDAAGVAITVFDDDGRDELAVARSQGGRTSYRNVARSERRGAEVSASLAFADAWSTTLAWTRLHATLGDDDTTMPGVPASFGDIELAYAPDDAWRVALEARGADRVFADDANATAAPSYVALNLAAQRRFAIGDDALTLYARVDNLADRTYVGSVIVNEANGRFFEPAAGRTWSIGAQWHWR